MQRTSSLFADAHGGETLLDDARGRITLHRDIIPATMAQRWFDALLADLPWTAQHRTMYERVVAVPRLQWHASTDAPAHPAIAEACAFLREHLGLRSDSVAANLYRDHHDSVAWHNDRLQHLMPGADISLLSLGATRTLSVRSKHAPRSTLRVPMQAGSVVVMSHATQLHFDHAILKEPAACGPRISLALRSRRRTSTPDARA